MGELKKKCQQSPRFLVLLESVVQYYNYHCSKNQ